MIALQESELIVGEGLQGQPRVSKDSKRQVLIMPAEVLEDIDVEPGTVRENITTRGLDIMALQRGDHLHVGEAVLEATFPCSPCVYLDVIQPGLMEASRGRRGMLFRVIHGGPIQIGDAIEIAETQEA